LRVIIVIVQIGAVKIYVAAVEALRKKERGDETQFTYHQNWWKKLVEVPLVLFRKISFPVKHLMPYYAKTGRSHPPNHLTLQITLIYNFATVN
jgi:hypothetical protein